jgi:flagellar motility protein MotE (MotC chaperone)
MGTMIRRLIPIRPLLAVALAAAVLLVLKLGTMIGGDPRPGGLAPLSLIPPAIASGDTTPATDAGKTGSKAANAEGNTGGGADGNGSAAGGKVVTAKSSPQRWTGKGEPDTESGGKTATQAPTFSASEVEVLQQLRQRREALDAREQELAHREELLHAAEQRIDARVNELTALKTKIEGLIKAHDAQNEQKMMSLVRIYENMKPEDAARIFEELDLDTILAVVERMKERKLAPILAQMQPAKARDVTVELARMKGLFGNDVKPDGTPAAAAQTTAPPAAGGAGRS